jgi:hypothetical protein
VSIKEAVMHTARSTLTTLTLTLLLTLFGLVLAQGSPSGEYGQVALGQSVSGVMIAATQDQIVFHTYVVAVAQGTPSLTISVVGDGADLDLAVKFGSPIVDYNDVDHLDTSEDLNPSYTIANPPAGVIYIDVLNLIAAPAAYQLSVTGAAATPGGQNPLGGAPNPFSPTGPAGDPFVGSFEGDGLGVVVQGGAGQYQGEMILGGQRFPFVATSGGEVLQGSFDSGGQPFPFTAVLQGENLVVESGGGLYTTIRVGAAPPPAPTQPVNPLGGTPNANDPVIAQGAYGVLTQDNALAFIEALEFSLQQVGYTYAFTDTDRQQLLQALVQSYPQGQPSDQAVLAQARQVWSQVQTNWPAADETSKREFIIGVFVLAFGPEAVQQAMASEGGGGGGGGGPSNLDCSDIDACVAAFSDPETYQDTVNAQSCWAAAGCTDYDPSSNDFYYEEPVFDIPSDF